LGQAGRAAADSDHESASSEAECIWVGCPLAGAKRDIETAAGEPGRFFELFAAFVSTIEGVYVVVVCGSGTMASRGGSGSFSSGA